MTCFYLAKHFGKVMKLLLYNYQFCQSNPVASLSYSKSSLLQFSNRLSANTAPSLNWFTLTTQLMLLFWGWIHLTSTPPLMDDKHSRETNGTKSEKSRVPVNQRSVFSLSASFAASWYQVRFNVTNFLTCVSSSSLQWDDRLTLWRPTFSSSTSERTSFR